MLNKHGVIFWTTFRLRETGLECHRIILSFSKNKFCHLRL